MAMPSRMPTHAEGFFLRDGLAAQRGNPGNRFKMKSNRKTNKAALWLAAGALGLSGASGRDKPQGENGLIPPATPLVACDPYFSIWSPGDKLTDVDTTHWTLKKNQLSSVVKIDGKAYRVMGATPDVGEVMDQKSLTVLPTRTLYTFEGGGVSLSLTFLTPALPEDIDLLSRPVTYLSYDFKATDGKEHDVSVFFGASADLTVNTPDQAVTWQDESAGGLSVVSAGSRDQQILAKAGDDQRIDWGYLYIAAPDTATSAVSFGKVNDLATSFAAKGLENAKGAKGAAEHAGNAGLGLELKALKVGAAPVSTWAMIAYDDLYSIQYNHKNLRPYWRRNGWEAKDLLAASAKQYPVIKEHCEKFDSELMADLTTAGGEKYAKLAALAYRQCFAAGKFVADEKGQPLSFCKENHSNGCIATSDVFYPMAPQFLLFGPSVAKSFVTPFMNYAKSDRWRFPFSPHDLGTYPLANGQVYGGGERTEDDQMPVEESGNLLILMAAIAQMDGNANYAGLYWDRLEQWAQYLKKEGFDPANQLCTDDFAGKSPHNVNLSAKAICGLGSFAKLCEMRGDRSKAEEYSKVAKQLAERWVKEAKDGDHYRLGFDKPGSWSQKYNLVWDRILGLNLFPADVARTEMDFYKKTQKTYGLPLDNRADYTKLDWTLWTATLTQDKADFEALVAPVFKFLNDTPDRTPMTDWYFTSTAKQKGFDARPVVGGVFIQCLYDKALWSKYAGQDRTKAANWAPMPDYVAPIVNNLTPSAADKKPGNTWQYTTDRPVDGWFETKFSDSAWKSGEAGFGAGGPPHAVIKTPWTTGDIWLRKEVTLPSHLPDGIAISAYHDEDLTVYINGVLAASAGGFTTDYQVLELSKQGKAALRPGKNLIAVQCHQTSGGQFVDVVIAEVRPGVKKR
jgi:hypothetical protein